MALTDNVANFLSSLDAISEIVPIEDLEMCLGPTLDTVRSQPNSPRPSSPVDSQGSSPVRTSDVSTLRVTNSGNSSVAEDEEDEEDFFSDTIEIVEPLTSEEVKDLRTKPVHANKVQTKEISTHAQQDEISLILSRTVESMNQEIHLLNSRVSSLEHKLVSLKRCLVTRGLFQNMTLETITFVILWPIIVSYLIKRLCYPKP